MAGGGGDTTPKCPPDDYHPPSPSFSHVPVADAPILLLVYFHNAQRQELADLHRLAVMASDGVCDRRELLVELRRRFDFLRLAHEYHSALEDEVIFLELDVRIKNVVNKYSLEHNSIDGLFGSIFHCLDTLSEENKEGCKPFQDLVSCIGTMHSCICRHMQKEEEQVFPLLMGQFSRKEQASFVWQFFSSIPVILLEVLLPWMISFVCLEKRVDIIQCIKEIVPEEKSLQEVVIYWLDQSSSVAFTKIKKEAPDGCEKSTKQLHFFSNPLTENWQWKETYSIQANDGNKAVEYLHLWHHAIQKDLKETLEEAYQRRNSRSFSDIDSIIVRMKFLADVIIFYSTALKKFFYPVLNELANNHLATCSSEQFWIESRIGNLHQLLQSNVKNGLDSSGFVEKLCKELEFFVVDVDKLFYSQEIEVFPLIGKNCSDDTQQQLLYTSLHLMPLGLLKCVIPWYAAKLSENESRSIFNGINKLGENLANKSFISLLLEWFHIGCSGKISITNFGKNLQKIFKSRCSFMPEQMKEAVGCSSFHSNKQPGEFKPFKTESISIEKGKMLLSVASSVSHEAETYETFYASEINLNVFFPRTKRILHSFPRLHGGESSATYIIDEPKPMDFIFFFHRALSKDLDSLVSGSAQLFENVRFLTEFSQHFHLLWLRYQFHSDTEDEICFPALEGKGKVVNISNSYSIDHKLEVTHFNEISIILDKMSKLHISYPNVDSSVQDQKMVKYNQLCMKLHHMCKSMHKLLSDHIHHEEIELWPLFREEIPLHEQEKIIGLMLGKARAETLQDMIPWLIGSLTPEEQHSMMNLFHRVTKNTMFADWLREWWEGQDIPNVIEDSNILCTVDPLEIISRYLSKDAFEKQGGIKFSQNDCFDTNIDMSGLCTLDNKEKDFKGDQDNEYSEREELVIESENKRCNEVANVIVKIDKSCPPFQSNSKSRRHEHLLSISQDDLEAAIRRVSRDTSLDPQKKSLIMQNLLMSRWIVQQRISHTEANFSSNGEEIPGQHPSYHDPLKVILGCKHYRRKCKLLTPCCNKLYTCIRCHDEEADHSTDRRAIAKMMCMECSAIQPIGQTCSTVSCNNLSMAKYYCKICKLFDDEREIYHCPFCNLCRVGKGLGIDYFHCMKCNACMSRSLLVHLCREKSLEGNCPICHDFIFTSSSPVKALPCGHVMHSTCFQEHTCTHYTCPICSKSLGDMRVYFKMLDALLSEEKIPDEYSGKTQLILCNDCEKKGSASFHWHYHKCQYCGSYNTRLI